MTVSLEEILYGMPREQRAMMIGEKSENPLTGAFAKKRVVHPGARGEPISPADHSRVWERLTRQSADAAKPRAAYFHIPFCSRMCLYCGFFQNYSDAEKETAYVDRLIAELEAARATPYFSGAPILTAYLGGGTPSALSPDNIARLLAAIRRNAPLANDYELTLEARAHDLTEEKMDAWFGGGVNRVSVGVQSFDTGIRRSIGRADDRKTVIERLERLASYRQGAVVIDLIYGLPGQTEESFVEDLRLADALPIDGMDLYQLNVFDESPLKKAIAAGRLPPAAQTARQAELFAAAEDYLENRAYIRKSNCHWAKSDRERNLYNSLSTCGAELFPFGSGAGGGIGGVSLYLERNLERYLRAVDGGKKPAVFMARQSGARPLHNDILFQLERGYLELGGLARRHGDIVGRLEFLLGIWEDRGLMRRGPELYRLTRAGRFWQMNIAQSLIECAEILFSGKWQFIVERVAEQG